MHSIFEYVPFNQKGVKQLVFSGRVNITRYLLNKQKRYRICLLGFPVIDCSPSRKHNLVLIAEVSTPTFTSIPNNYVNLSGILLRSHN